MLETLQNTVYKPIATHFVTYYIFVLLTPFQLLENRVIPIDYEYCAYNYRAFDLANHFSEWMYDYTKKEYPYYRRNRRFFPSKERQVR